MKDFLKVFIPAFIFFAVIGGVQGYSHDARQKVAHELILKNAELTEQEDGTYLLEFVCKDNSLTSQYSIDSNSIDLSNNDAGVLMSHKIKALALSSERCNEHRALITTMLGGGSVGFTLQQALKPSPTKWNWTRVKNTIAGLIGSVTGYYTGYWLASHYGTDCGSDIFASVASDSDKWLQVERTFLAISLRNMASLPDAKVSQTGRVIYEWDKDPAFMCSPKLKSLKPFLAEQITDPTSEHYRIAVEIAGLFTKISQTQDYRTLIDTRYYTETDMLQKRMEKGAALHKLIETKKEERARACSNIASINL